MDTPQEKSPADIPANPTRRNVLIGAGAVAVLAVAGGYYVWNRGKASAAPQTTAEASQAPAAPSLPPGVSAELMTPGPLGEQALGEANAPVTIIEYASMTCPHCAHFHETAYPELKKRYIDTGKVRFIFREFPLDPLAAAGFMLARCAGPNKYFPVIETLFAQQKEWVVEKPLQPLLTIARQAGFTQESFDACLKDQRMLDGIEEVRARGTKFQVTSTPTFFINGKKLSGAPTIEELAKQIEPYLKG
jgi:protein-disulfide isomerase